MAAAPRRIGNIGENCSEPSEEFQLGNHNGSVGKSNPLPKDENLGLWASTSVPDMDFGGA